MSIKSIKKVLSKSFVDNNENIDEDAAGALIVQAEQAIKEINEERATNEKLAAAKQIAKDINSAYGSAVKYERAKIQFLQEKIEEIQNGDDNPDSAVNS
jgi:hypothetical protein